MDKGSKDGEWITGLIDIRLELHGRKEKEGEGEKEGEKVNELSLSNISRFSLDKILLDSEGGSKLSESSDKKSQIFECWLPCAVYCEDKTSAKTSTQNSDINSELVDPSSGIQGTGSRTADSGSGTGLKGTETGATSKGEIAETGTGTGAGLGGEGGTGTGLEEGAGVGRGAGVGLSSGDSQDCSDGLGQGQGQGQGGYYLNASFPSITEDSKVNDSIDIITEKEKERENEEKEGRKDDDEVIMNIPKIRKYRSNSTANELKLDGVSNRYELSRSFSEASMRFPDLLSPLKYARSVVVNGEKNGEMKSDVEEKGRKGNKEGEEGKEGGSEKGRGEEKEVDGGGGREDEKGGGKDKEGEREGGGRDRERGGGMEKEERHEDKEKRRRATHHHHPNPITTYESNTHTAITSPRRWSLDSIYALNQNSSSSYSLPPMSQSSQGNDMMSRQINEIAKFKILENERNERIERNEKGEKLRKNSKGEIIVRYEKYENNGVHERKGSRRDLSVTALNKEKDMEKEKGEEKGEEKEEVNDKEKEREREKRIEKEREKERERNKEKEKERDKRNDKSSEKIYVEDNQKRRRSLLATFSSAAMLSSPSHSQSYLASQSQSQSQSHTQSQSQSILDSDTHTHNDSFNSTRKARRLSSDSFSGSFFSRMSRVFNLTTSSPSPTHNQLSNTLSRFTTKNSDSVVYEKRSPKSRLRVLLIEDSLAAQKLLGSWLRANGCDVMGALNGKLGLKCMKVKQFDICFVDFVTVRTYVILCILLTAY